MRLFPSILHTGVTSLALICCFLVAGPSYGQTQATSIRSGVTFQWSDVQSVPQDPITIESITVDGVIYQSFAVPSSYQLTRLGPNGHRRNSIFENGVEINNSSASLDWTLDATTAFQDKNLNHYFSSGQNGVDFCEDFTVVNSVNAQIQSLIYDPPIPSNRGGLIAITEREANNCFYIVMYGIPVGGGAETFLGDTFVRPNDRQRGLRFDPPADKTDYWNAGRVLDNNGTLGLALFTLNDLAPTGSLITRVDLVASTRDHGDGKFFIMEKFALPINERSCINENFNGTVNGNTAPSGSTYRLLSGPNPPGESFQFNPDGTYTYVPAVNFLGDVTFNYEVCLPAPNETECDVDTVTITYETGPGTGCECDSGNADAPSLQN